MESSSQTSTAKFILHGETWMTSFLGNNAWVWMSTRQCSSRNVVETTTVRKEEMKCIQFGISNLHTFADDVFICLYNSREMMCVHTHTHTHPPLSHTQSPRTGKWVKQRHNIDCWKEGFPRFFSYSRIRAIEDVTRGGNWVKDI